MVQNRQSRQCSECPGIIPGNARRNTVTCSPLCKVKRAQRLRRTYWRRCRRVECGKQFSTHAREQDYCSRSCARQDARNRAQAPPITRPCGTCQEPTANEKYCSRVCASQARTIEAVKRWLDGNAAPPTDGRLTDPMKRYLLAEAGDRCPRCGWSEVNPELGHVVLCIVRIDGDKRNAARSNLEVRCCNCATVTGVFDPSTIVIPQPGWAARTWRALTALSG